MARITVEDCMQIIPNRFTLVIAAVTRARELQKGYAPVIKPRPHDKHTVTALREIASGNFSPEKIKQLSRG